MSFATRPIPKILGLDTMRSEITMVCHGFWWMDTFEGVIERGFKSVHSICFNEAACIGHIFNFDRRIA